MYGELFVVSLLCRDDWCIGCKHKVNAWVWHQVGLELRKIDVKSTIETKRCSQGRYNLSDQSVKVGVGRTFNIQVTAAHIVKGFVIKTEGAVSVLQKGVGRKHVVVWLDNSSGDLRSWGHSERKLGFATIIDGQTLKKKGTKTGSSSTSSGVEDHESLQTCAVVSKLADSVKDKVDDFLTNGVVTTGVVVGSIFLTRDDLLWVVKLTVGTSADFVTHSRFQVNKDSTRNVLTCTSLREKGVEGIITSSDSLVTRHLAIRLDTVFKAVQLPASVTCLDTSLTNMNRKALTHC